MKIDMDCPGCGTQLVVCIEPECNMQHIPLHDGTAEIWQYGELFHRCDPEISQEWRQRHPRPLGRVSA